MALFARLGVGTSTVLTRFVGPHLPPLLLLPVLVKVTFGLRTPLRLPSILLLLLLPFSFQLLFVQNSASPMLLLLLPPALMLLLPLFFSSQPTAPSTVWPPLSSYVPQTFLLLRRLERATLVAMSTVQ